MESENETFGAIIADAIEQAERVDVPFDEFVNGLELMASELNDRLNCARDELRSKTLK